MIIFLTEFSLSLLAYGLLAKYIWWDALKNQPPDKANALLLVPHSFRHLGLLALVPEVVGEPVTKTAFASMLAYGDAVVAPLALLTIWLWLSGNRQARLWTWIFSVVASLDLVKNNATVFDLFALFPRKSGDITVRSLILTLGEFADDVFDPLLDLGIACLRMHQRTRRQIVTERVSRDRVAFPTAVNLAFRL